MSHDVAGSIYSARLDAGVARELARKDLPLSLYTEAYWKIDLHNLLHFLKLRMDSHAQLEIREYANVIGNKIVAEWCPATWAAFKDYVLDSVTLSARDIQMMNAQSSEDRLRLEKEFGWTESSTEKREHISKIKKLR